MAKAKKKADDEDTDDADEPKVKTKARPKAKADGPKARNDAYVMMLFITLVAMIAGSALMYLDNEEYGGKAAPKEAVPALPKLGDATKAAPAAAAPAEPKAAEPKGMDPMMGMMPPP